MKKLLVIPVLLLLLSSCRRVFEAPIPDLSWPLFNSPAASPLPFYSRSKLEGVYQIQGGNEVFGNDAAFKWSYTVNGTDTTYYVSAFCQRQAAYLICQGKKLDSSVLLNGYWRRPVSTETGRVQLTISAAKGGGYLLSTASSQPAIFEIEGMYGLGEAVPDQPIKFSFQKKLPGNGSFEVVAHRGGGRTSDLLPASENSVQMIQLASRFGATGIEIDVRMTKDHVPVLFHDATLNERLIQKNGLVGAIENYTYDQLSTLVRLTEGEKIPTLREALYTVVYETPLRFVWLDTKYSGSLEPIRQIQQEFMARANAVGRSVSIYIGIPDDQVLEQFTKLSNYKNVPSICELSTDKVLLANSTYWAPQWTEGLQNEESARMHGLGKKVIPWTLDIPENIEEYLLKGNFDAILSNYPSAVAYYYYVRK